jgi:exodeoxyribonuclease VII small subunit
MEKKLEEQLQDLELIIKDLESGDLSLDDAINKYTEAMKIAKSASDKLNKAEEQINQILKDNKLEEFNVEQ